MAPDNGLMTAGGHVSTMSTESEPTATFDEIRDAITAELAELVAEVEVCRTDLMIPGLGKTPPTFYSRVLFGFVMSAMSFVDLLSRYRYTDASQTPRMVRLFTDYLGAEDLAAAVAVQMWRHGLMHTGCPVTLVDAASDEKFEWYLVWDSPGVEYLGSNAHLGFQVDPPRHRRILNMTLTRLVKDLLIAGTGVFDDLAVSHEDRARVEKVHVEVSTKRLKLPS
jgi:hypothetical protein